MAIIPAGEETPRPVMTTVPLQAILARRTGTATESVMHVMHARMTLKNPNLAIAGVVNLNSTATKMVSVPVQITAPLSPILTRRMRMATGSVMPAMHARMTLKNPNHVSVVAVNLKRTATGTD